MDNNIKNINPFPGIRNFESDESKLFFGREKLIQEIIGRLSEKHFLAVIGSSGSGKSSLIRAGVIPRLFTSTDDEMSQWNNLSIFRPGDNPINNMAASLYKTYDFNSLSKENISEPEHIAKYLREGSENLINFVKRHSGGSEARSLIVIDQFEELFRYKQNQTSEEKLEEVRLFINLFLTATMSKEAKLYIILIMRSDFIDDCREYLNLFNAIKEGNYLVPRMSDIEIREAITGPVRFSGTEISSNLVDRLIEDIKDEQDQLPILQHALMRTWDYWYDNRTENKKIEVVHYEAIGTIHQALSLHGEEIYNQLPDQRSKDITEKLFKALTELGPDNRGTRRPTSLQEICILANAKEEEVINVADHFRANGCAFLMPSPKMTLSHDSILDISHESIMRVWNRLKKWVEEETKSASLYQRLAETARLYQEGKTGLWVNPELQLALKWQQQSKPNETWAMRYDPSFERAISFLDYSKKEFEKSVSNKENLQKKRLKNARRIALILGSASLISLLFLIVALNLRFKSEVSEKKALEAKIVAIQERKKAVKQSKEAVLQKKISEQQQQIAEQQTIITEEQRLYALEQKRMAEFNANEALIQKKLADDAKDAAEKARDEAEIQRKEAVEQRKEAVSQKKIAENERIKAEKSEENAQRLRLLAIARSMAIQATKFQYSIKNDLPALLALQAYKFVEKNNGNLNDPDIYQALSNVANDMKIYRSHDDAVRAIEISPKGRTMVTSSDDGTVRLWNFMNLRNNTVELETGNSGKYGIRSVCYSDNENYLLAGAFNGNILAWDITLKDPTPIIFKGHSNVVNKVKFLKNSYKFVSASSDGTLRLWNLEQPLEQPQLIKKFNSRLLSLVISNDGRKMACGTDDGSIYLFATGNLNREPVTLESGTDAVRSLAFNADDSKLASGTAAGLVKVWDINDLKKKSVDYIGHISGVSDIKFSPNDQFLATASYDGTIRLWDYKEPQQRPIVLDKHDSWVYSICFSPDGNKLISGSADKTVRSWTVVTKLMADKVCNSVSRNLLPNEWNKYVGTDIEYERTCDKYP